MNQPTKEQLQMNKELEKILDKYTLLQGDCPYCNCGNAQSIDEWIKSVESCQNCTVDIMSHGLWTGCVPSSLKKLASLLTDEKSQLKILGIIKILEI